MMPPRVFSGALASRAVLRVVGADASSMLQSSVTNDVHALCAERFASAYAAVLTPKGKIFIDVFITRLDDEKSGEKIGFLLDVDRARVDETTNVLKRLSLRKDVRVERACDAYEVSVVLPGGESEGKNIGFDPRFDGLGRRGVTKRDAAAQPSTSMDAAHRVLRMTHGIAEGVSELADAYPLECNFDALNGVSFTKGCYMGQENTARQHFRGAVRKRVVPFAFSGTSVDVGAKVINEKGDAVGDVIAVEQDRGLMRARMKFIRETLASAAPLRSADGVALDVAVPVWWPTKYLESVD